MHSFGRDGFRSVALILFPVFALAARPQLQEGSDAVGLYGADKREAQYRALIAMRDVQVDYGHFGRAERVDGSTRIALLGARTLREGHSGAEILRLLGPILMASGSESLRIRHTADSVHGGRYIFAEQQIDGLPVIDAGLNIRVSQNGEITAVRSRFVPDVGLASRTPKVSIGAARKSIEEVLIATGWSTVSSVRVAQEGSLAFWTDEGKEDRPRLIWLLDATFSKNGESHSGTFGVDATSGAVRYSARQQAGLNRTVRSLNYLNTSNVDLYPQAQLLWTEGSPSTGDPLAYNAYHSVSWPRQAWASWYGSSVWYDNLTLMMHHGNSLASFYQSKNGMSYIVLGDARANDDDAIAHEYGHGVFMPWAPGRPAIVKFWDEYFAANEFWGDLSVVLTDAHRWGSTDWYVSNLRNLANPASQGSHRDWYPDRRFFGFTDSVAYDNSTIFSHAVYLMWQGGYHSRAGGFSETTGTVPHILVPPVGTLQMINAIFSSALVELAFNYSAVNGPNLKAATSQSALVIGGAYYQNAVATAWTAVGIGYNCSSAPAVPAITVYPGFCRGEYEITWVQQPSTKYHGELAPPSLGFNYATTTLDAAVSTCSQDAPGPSWFRMRACNACGCSNWTPARYFQYYSPCL